MEEILQKVVRSLQQGKPCACATIVESTAQGTPRKIGAKMVVFSDGSSFGTVGGGQNEENVKRICIKAIKSKKYGLVPLAFSKKNNFLCGGHIKVFIEPFLAQKDLIICGGGHIGLPLSVIGKVLGFKVTVLDSRKEFANKKRFGHADKVVCANITQSLSKIAIGPSTFIVIIGHSHEIDFSCLKKVARSKAGYIGIISSASKRQEFIKRLKSLGVPKNDINKIKMPIGLDIGAQTPQEIAIAIAAEIVSVLNKDLIGTPKFRSK